MPRMWASNRPMKELKALYFGATFCAQCRSLRPKFIAECNRLGIECSELDADEDSTLFEAYNIRSVPFIVVHTDDGKLVKSGVAADILKELEEIKTRWQERPTGEN